MAVGIAIPQSFDFRSLPKLVRRGCHSHAHSKQRVLTTGLERIDAQLPERGLPLGALSELTGRKGSGKLSLALSALARVIAHGDRAALIDPDATALPNVWSNPELERLLVIRGGAVRGALRAADALLKTGAFTLLVLDLPGRAAVEQTNGASRAIPSGTFLRLAREASKATTALLILSEPLPWRPEGIARARLRLDVRRTRAQLEVDVKRGAAYAQTPAR
jgi:hypothetical protein